MSLRTVPRELSDQVNLIEEQLRRLQATLAASPGDVRLLFDARGDLLVGAEDDLPQRLGRGAEGEVLTSDPSAALGLAWAALDALRASLIPAKGALIVGVSVGEASALEVGPDGTVATADSSSPLGIRWVASAESDAQVLAWLALGMGS